MAKNRFHELFQDYVGSCVIRAAREVFGLLPFDYAVVTASVPTLAGDTSTSTGETPVLSAAFSREAFMALPFDSLDPSDTVETFPHRGDVKTSRKTGEFVAVVPLSIQDLPRTSRETATLEEMLAAGRALREAIEAKRALLTPRTAGDSTSSGDGE
jgi:hypothetical protein